MLLNKPIHIYFVAGKRGRVVKAQTSFLVTSPKLPTCWRQVVEKESGKRHDTTDTADLMQTLRGNRYNGFWPLPANKFITVKQFDALKIDG